MTVHDVMKQLEQLGTEQHRKIYTNHGCDIDQYGVSIANLKQVLKPIKKNKSLGRELFLSSNSDAIYLSQWMVEPEQFTKEEIESRIRLSNFYLLIENVIPNILVKNVSIGKQYVSSWIDHAEPRFRQAAYSLYGNLLSLYPDTEFDREDVLHRLHHIKNVIHQEENRVRYAMNQFVIAAGAYMESVYPEALSTANTIGQVKVSMGHTACKVPFAPAYLKKIQSMNRIGQKRKS